MSYSPWQIESYRQNGWYLAANLFDDRPLGDYLKILKDYTERRPEMTFRMRHRETGDIIMGDIL